MEGSSQFYDATEGSSHPTNPEQVSSEAADLAHEDFKLPESNKCFLDKFELLLSEAEVTTFNHLYLTENFTEPNLPYQSWLVLKHGLEPVVEQEAMEEVLISHTPRKIGKSKKRRGQRQPSGPSRYKIVSYLHFIY